MLSNNQPATFLKLTTDPIMKGVAGTAGTLTTSWPAFFTNLGKSTEVAQLTANSMPLASYLPAHALSATSGAVVFFADSSVLVDGIRTANDRIAILNSLGFTK